MGIDILIMEMCESLRGSTFSIPGSGSKNYQVYLGLNDNHCSCKSFYFRKHCKHIEEAQKQMCGWHQQWGNEILEEKGTCPKCGGPTVPCRVGV